jgi:hypothetical protein
VLYILLHLAAELKRLIRRANLSRMFKCVSSSVWNEVHERAHPHRSKAANTVPQPAGLASIGSAIFAIAPNSTGSDKGVIDALESGKSKAKLPVKYTPSAIDASSSSKVVAVGGDVSVRDRREVYLTNDVVSHQDKLYLYSWDGQLKQAGQPTPYKGTVSALAFSPDGKLLAAGYVRLLYILSRITISNFNI